MDEAWRRLTSALDDDPRISDIGLDQGTGTHEPVLGVTFVVAAGSGPEAASYGVERVEAALSGISQGLYGVTVVAPQGDVGEDRDRFPPLLD